MPTAPNSCADLLFCMANCPGGDAFEGCQNNCYAQKKNKVKNQYEALNNCWNQNCENGDCPQGACVEQVGACLGTGPSSCEQLHACLYLCPDSNEGCTTGCIMGATPEAYVQFDTYQGCFLGYCDGLDWLMPDTCIIVGHLMCVDEALECGYGIGEDKENCLETSSCLFECEDSTNPYCILNCLYNASLGDILGAGPLQECLLLECEDNLACLDWAMTQDGPCATEAALCGL